MLVKLVNFISCFIILFFRLSQAHAHESPDYIKYAFEARKSFITEMEKKYKWASSGAGASMPSDVEELSATFRIDKKVSRDEARQLLIPAVERFREVIQSHEKLRPYLRYYPLDIQDVKIFLYFKDPYGTIRTDGCIVSVCNNWEGNLIYKAAKEGRTPGSTQYYEIYRESYDEALKILNIEQPPHISLVKKIRNFRHKSTKKDINEAKKNIKTPGEQEELILVQYGPGDELKILELSDSNFCNSVEEAIRERIRGIAEKYFDEDFFARIAAKEKESSDGEYIEYWPNGELKVKVQWKNGKPDGHMHGWYPNCLEAFKAYFKEGLKQGIHLSFLPVEWRAYSGFIMKCYSYNEKGQLHGEQDIRYPGGQLKASIHYRNGILHGKASTWYFEKDGSIRRWEYKQGKLIASKNQTSSK
jgi:antitoxin component YwqK of YwqJK toxin-antitoxin module